MTQAEIQATTEVVGLEKLHKIERRTEELKTEDRGLSFMDILSFVSKQEGISIQEMKQHTKKSKVVQARQLVYALSTVMLPAHIRPSCSKLGAFFGQGHSTVSHARKLIFSYVYPELQERYYIYKRKL